jgi:hypothetical protein
MDQNFEMAKSAIMEILFIYIILAFSIVFCFVLFRFFRKKIKNKKNIGRYEKTSKRMN